MITSRPSSVLRRYWRQLAAVAASLALLLVPCSARASAIEVVDADGHSLRLAGPARRIVSLAPHLTELLFAAGAGGQVVGAVSYSDYPPAAASLPRVGSYNQLDLEAILALRPDLVIGWRSGNPATQIERLRALGVPVYVNEPRDFDDLARSLELFGVLAGQEDDARQAAAAFRRRHDQLAARYRAQAKVRVFYQIWERPMMTINDEHLIGKVIALCGGENVFGRLSALTPTVSVEAVLAARPEAIIASGMDEARPQWLDQWRQWPQLPAAAAGHLFFIPPDLLQRHTPRILDGAEQLCAQLEIVRRARDGNPAAQ